MAMSIRPGMKLAVKQIWVPPVGQNPRLASGDDAYLAGAAATKLTCASWTLPKARVVTTVRQAGVISHRGEAG